MAVSPRLSISVLVVAGEWLPLSPVFSVSPFTYYMVFISTHVFPLTFSLFINSYIPLKGGARKELLGAKLLTRVSPLPITNVFYGCVDHNAYFLTFGNLVALFTQYATWLT